MADRVGGARAEGETVADHCACRVLLAVARRVRVCSRAVVCVVPGLPDFGAEAAAVGHGQADAAAPAADLGSCRRARRVPVRDR